MGVDRASTTKAPHMTVVALKLSKTINSVTPWLDQTTLPFFTTFCSQFVTWLVYRSYKFELAVLFIQWTMDTL